MTKDFLVPSRGTILHLWCFGDQHHPTSADLKAGKKVISDGGSNIHIHFLAYLKDTFPITIFTYKDNYQIKNFFGNCPSIQVKEFFTLSGFFKKYLMKIEVVTRCVFPALFFLFKKLDYQYVITQTDFLPDTFAAFCLKVRNPNIRWIASFFLAAPAPWAADSPYHGKRWIIGFFYWLLQKPSILFIKWKADKILVTSEPDVHMFLGATRDAKDIIAIQGGVDVDASEEYLQSNDVVPVDQRRYDACFVGRLHYQKGVVELIEIWEQVCKVKKDAKLAIIGAGELADDVAEAIKKYTLEHNVDMLGLKHGLEKYEIFKQSKIMVHPATYDSGGMAMAGGMAWGLPGVSFDLEALKTYYPKGVIKTPIGDKKQFARNIERLLHDKDLYDTTAREARDLIIEVWDWEKRLGEISSRLFS